MAKKNLVYFYAPQCNYRYDVGVDRAEFSKTLRSLPNSCTSSVLRTS